MQIFPFSFSESSVVRSLGTAHGGLSTARGGEASRPTARLPGLVGVTA